MRIPKNWAADLSPPPDNMEIDLMLRIGHLWINDHCAGIRTRFEHPFVYPMGFLCKFTENDYYRFGSLQIKLK